MEADIKWLDDPEIFQVNRKNAHSDHRIFASHEEASEGISSMEQSLNGEWMFSYAVNAKTRKADFYKPGYDYSDFDTIMVPGHIELAGYDTIHYINTMYPWEGKEYRRPSYTLGKENSEEGMFSEADYNPVGSYVRRFQLNDGLKGKKVSVRFAGAEQAIYVWLNGYFLGYSEDSFSPAEFELTEYLQEENILAVEVHKRSTAAWLEDQDFFRFSGIFRDVTLIARNANHLEDLWIHACPDDDMERGSLKVDCLFEETLDDVKLHAEILNPEGESIYNNIYDMAMLKTDARMLDGETASEDTRRRVELDFGTFSAIRIWDTCHPWLYILRFAVIDAKGDVLEYTEYSFGFRRISIQNKVIMLNNKRLIINGVNRHEWSPRTGRVISAAEMQQDIDVMKRNHINAVRTSHYPNQTIWYGMCDREGIYVMAETNLETHGTWQKWYGVEPSYNVPGSIPQWLGAVMDRARSNFETLKNHTSILFWSLGNESYALDNIEQMDQYYHQVDPERLTHYESSYWNPDYEERMSDVKSRMYPQPAEIREYLDHDPKKPFLNCEYMHGMGNSVGGLNTYMELIDRYEMFQGGFIWDFIDQALFVYDEVTGRKVLRYGGDFDDRPSDYEFSGNGLLFADRTEKPAMQEVRYFYEKYSR